MRNILIALDDSKGAKKAFSFFCEICASLRPENIVLLFVERFEGKSLIAEMLGDAEMSTLKEVLHGSEYKEILDKKAYNILDYYRKALEDMGLSGIRTTVRAGRPADEILQAAREENAEMIVVGSHGEKKSHLFMGSVSREVADRAEVPVLIVK